MKLTKNFIINGEVMFSYIESLCPGWMGRNGENKSASTVLYYSSSP